MSNKLTAAILIIGNEILSGRTQDLNIQYIASKLTDKGIHLEEVRIIPDIAESIIESVNLLRKKYTYLFTTGGIGPTHDDITSAAMAEAFGMHVTRNEDAYRLIKEYYAGRGRELIEASKKMAYIPDGARLIDNSETGAPGFIIENVYVMAGVPYIMQAMMEFVLPMLENGSSILSRSIELDIGESIIAREMEAIQHKYPTVSVGSYPFVKGDAHGTSVVMRSDDEKTLDKAYKEFLDMV